MNRLSGTDARHGVSATTYAERKCVLKVFVSRAHRCLPGFLHEGVLHIRLQHTLVVPLRYAFRCLPSFTTACISILRPAVTKFLQEQGLLADSETTEPCLRVPACDLQRWAASRVPTDMHVPHDPLPCAPGRTPKLPLGDRMRRPHDIVRPRGGGAWHTVRQRPEPRCAPGL